jgi:hypothetical protein
LNSKFLTVYISAWLLIALPAPSGANEAINAVMLVYQEQEQGVDPYLVTFTVSSDYIRIDDDSDNSGYIVFDISKNSIYSVSHFDKSILVIPQYPETKYDPDFDIDIQYRVLENAPMISGKQVYNYRVKAMAGDKTDTCMDIQLVPGLLPEVSKSLQSFQKTISGQHVNSLGKTPGEYQTPCYLVDQVYNKGDYYSKGLPIQEWHSNEKRRQLMNFEDAEVDASIFDIPDEYRQYSLK